MQHFAKDGAGAPPGAVDRGAIAIWGRVSGECDALKERSLRNSMSFEERRAERPEFKHR
ncbi:MAG TPA: hypothetical protein PKV78_01815 [Methanoculleus thermophilus]|nr:hypothetical protein [Methanoculleus thermophilus]